MNPDKKKVKPFILPRKIEDWIKQESTTSQVNNYKKGGGKPAWNGNK